MITVARAKKTLSRMWGLYSVRILIAAILIASPILMDSDDAVAQCGDPCSYCNQCAAEGIAVTEPEQQLVYAAQFAISQVMNAILNFFKNTLLPTLEDDIASTIGANAASHKTAIAAASKINDVNDSNIWAVEKARAIGQATATTRPTTAGCQLASGMREARAAEYTVPALTASYDTGEINDESNNGPISQNGTTAQAIKAYTYQNSDGGSKASYGMCDEQNVTTCTQAGDAIPNAETRPNAIFDYSTYNPNPTQSNSAAQLETAAIDYCKTLVETLNLNPLKKDLLNTPQGLAAYEIRKANDARMQLAHHVCDEIVSERTPIQNGSASTYQWGKKIMADIGRSAITPPSFSHYEIMELLYNDEFGDPAWEQYLASDATHTAQLRILSYLTAMRLQMQWQNSQQLEEIELLEATKNALTVEHTRVDVPTTTIAPSSSSAP